MAKKRIYLDTASGTGNPSSIHAEGVAAEKALEGARVSVAANLAAQPDEVVFTSGGTEGNNLALFGVVAAFNKKPHIIVSAIEHASVLLAAKELEKRGVALTILPVDKDGVVDLKVLKASLRPNTILVSIMFANNEIGTVEPIKEIAKIIRQFKKDNNQERDHANYPYFHTDACQATRFFDLDVRKLGVDLITINSNKVYGPKGVGALFVRRGVKIKPLFFGGGQENNLRSGTENVSGIVAFAKAFGLAAKLRGKETKTLTKLRDYAVKKIQKEIPTAILNGPPPSSRAGHQTNRLPNNFNFTFPNVDHEWLVLTLDAHGVAVSTGSACSFNSNSSDRDIMSVRFTLGRDIKKGDLDYTIKLLKKYAHSA